MSTERVIFPSLNNKLDFSGETEAHKLIHVKLDVLSAFIIEAKADASKFHAAQMKNMMEELREPLVGRLSSASRLFDTHRRDKCSMRTSTRKLSTLRLKGSKFSVARSSWI